MRSLPTTSPRRQYNPQIVQQTVPVTRQVAIRDTRKVTYNVTRYEQRQTTRRVAVNTTRYVESEETVMQPVTVYRTVPTGSSIVYGVTPYGATSQTVLSPVPDPVSNSRTATNPEKFDRSSRDASNDKKQDPIKRSSFSEDKSTSDDPFFSSPDGAHATPTSPGSEVASTPSIVRVSRWRPTGSSDQKNVGPKLISPSVASR